MKFSTLLLALVLAAVTVDTVQSEGSATVDEATQTVAAEDDFEISEEEPVDPVDPISTGEEVPLQQEETKNQTQKEPIGVLSDESPGVQAGPFIELFGPTLLSLEMIDESHAQLVPHNTNEALNGKKVVGLYFSADWCGPCRQFTPELVSFYNKMNSKRGKKDQFEIVWVSRCRDVNSFGQYFTQMNWLALPPEEALGERGQMLGQQFKVKSIPTLVLLDDVGNVITTDARNKIPQDKAGIGFPWRNPLATIYMTVLPKSLRLMVRSQLSNVKKSIVGRIKGLVGIKSVPAVA